MDRKAGLAALAAVPFLAAVCWYLTSTFTPIWGYFGTLAVYWCTVLIPLMLWRRPSLRLLRLGDITKGLIGLAALPVVLVSCVAGFTLSHAPIPLWTAGIVIVVALCNGTLEELFWRGTVQTTDATIAQMGAGVAMFTGWHLALLAAQGVTVTGGALGLLMGAAGGGILWAYLRAKTKAVGLPVLSHIGLNIAAFLELTSHNLV